MIIAGLDVGTTGCKLTSYDENGTFVYNSYKEYEVRRTGGAHEIDVDIIWDAVQEIIRDTAAHHEIAAIGVTTFGETFVLLDENDRPLLPAMLYTDPRGEAECAALCETLGEERIIAISGAKPHSKRGSRAAQISTKDRIRRPGRRICEHFRGTRYSTAMAAYSFQGYFAVIVSVQIWVYRTDTRYRDTRYKIQDIERLLP